MLTKKTYYHIIFLRKKNKLKGSYEQTEGLQLCFQLPWGYSQKAEVLNVISN